MCPWNTDDLFLQTGPRYMSDLKRREMVQLPLILQSDQIPNQSNIHKPRDLLTIIYSWEFNQCLGKQKVHIYCFRPNVKSISHMQSEIIWWKSTDIGTRVKLNAPILHLVTYLFPWNMCIKQYKTSKKAAWFSIVRMIYLGNILAPAIISSVLVLPELWSPTTTTCNKHNFMNTLR